MRIREWVVDARARATPRAGRNVARPSGASDRVVAVGMRERGHARERRCAGVR